MHMERPTRYRLNAFPELRSLTRYLLPSAVMRRTRQPRGSAPVCPGRSAPPPNSAGSSRPAPVPVGKRWPACGPRAVPDPPPASATSDTGRNTPRASEPNCSNRWASERAAVSVSRSVMRTGLFGLALETRYAILDVIISNDLKGRQSIFFGNRKQ